MIHKAKLQEAHLGQPTFSWAAQKKKKDDYIDNETVEYDSCKNVTAKYEWVFIRHVPNRSL